MNKMIEPGYEASASNGRGFFIYDYIRGL